MCLLSAGHCVVDQTEKGWFVQYIDRDPETIRRQTEMAKKEKMELDDEERTARFIQVPNLKINVALIIEFLSLNEKLFVEHLFSNKWKELRLKVKHKKQNTQN